MSIKIDRAALEALTAIVQKLNSAINALERLETTEKIPADKLYWITIGGSRAGDDDISKRLVQSAEAAAKRRAAEMGAVMRADALDKAANEIDVLRAVLCSQAASATIELARIVRDARERG